MSLPASLRTKEPGNWSRIRPVCVHLVCISLLTRQVLGVKSLQKNGTPPRRRCFEGNVTTHLIALPSGLILPPSIPASYDTSTLASRARILIKSATEPSSTPVKSPSEKSIHPPSFMEAHQCALRLWSSSEPGTYSDGDFVNWSSSM